MAVTSKSLRGVAELTLIAAIKPGLVNVAEPIAYSGRLRLVLTTLFELRRRNAEASPIVPLAGPLEQLRTLHFLNWSLIDHDQKLLLTVAFDGPWEAYIRQIVEVAGPLLDIIFCHCDDYERHSCLDGYQGFSQWVRARQIDSSFMYTTAPDLTVEDRRYLQQFERQATALSNIAGQAPAAVKVPDPGVSTGSTDQVFVAALGTLFPLRRFFNHEQTRGSEDHLYLFDRAVELFTRHLRVHSSAAAPWPNPVLQRWADQLPNVMRPRPQRQAPQLDDPASLQGNILEHYAADGLEPTHGCVVFLRFAHTGASAPFLQGIAGQLTTHPAANQLELRLNLGLTHRGLVSAGASPELLAALPREFQEGMEQRAGLLGDVGANHPSNWERLRCNWPDPSGSELVELSTIDAVLILQTYQKDPIANDHEWTRAHPLFDHVSRLAQTFKSDIQILHVQPLRRTPRGHFNLTDGISQPLPRRAPEDTSRDAVALGELVLGYTNDRGELSPIDHRIAKNSTFMVMRKMAQDVRAFEQVSLGRPEYKAKILGRHPDGTPLVPSNGSNDFDYRHDPDGHACPFFSHVRRSNPRQDRFGADFTPPPPRILRRGFSYGPPVEPAELGTPAQAPANRGTVFMAYCTNIADQYEVIQRWVNGGNSSDGFSAHPDFIAGTFPPGGTRTQAFFDGTELRRLTLPARPTAQLRWGLYLFVPSVPALAALSPKKADDDRRYEPQKPTELEPPPALKHLFSIEQSAPDKALDEWRRFLEESSLRAEAVAIWKYVRDRGGALRSRYGVLVGGADAVLTVLQEGHNYSVREYYRRMQQSFGGHYLGMDLEPKPGNIGAPAPPNDYRRESEVPNAYLNRIGYAETFASAHSRTLAWFAEQRGRAFLPDLARTVLAEIARARFGLPDLDRLMTASPDPGPSIALSQPQPADNRRPARCPADFVNSAQYIFRPNPVEALEAAGKRRGPVIIAAAQEFVQRQNEAGPLLAELRRNGFQGDESAAIVGAINGFTVPTMGSFLGILGTWMKTRELGRLRQWFSSLSQDQFEAIANADDLPDGKNPLVDAVLRAFVQAPIPDLLHRTAVEKVTIGAVEIEPGERVVISLASAATAAHAAARPDFWTLLFGGDYRLERRPLHACPGHKMGLGALLGMICGILSQKDLEVTPSRLTLAYDPNWATRLAAGRRPY